MHRNIHDSALLLIKQMLVRGEAARYSIKLWIIHLHFKKTCQNSCYGDKNSNSFTVLKNKHNDVTDIIFSGENIISA